MGNLSELFLMLGVGLVVGVVVAVMGVMECPIFWIVILDCLKYIFHGVCRLVSVYYMGLGSFGYSFVGKRDVLQCVVYFLLVLLGFCGRFESPLVLLSVCHWEW